jgi:DNA mismatch repair protein MLH1
MYQQALCRFGNFNAIKISEPAPLRELLLMALKEDELMGDENDEEKLEIAEVSCSRMAQFFVNVVGV